MFFDERKISKQGKLIETTKTNNDTSINLLCSDFMIGAKVMDGKMKILEISQ